MELSIVIVSYNAGGPLRACLTSVLADIKESKLETNVELIVVDNHSSDPEVHRVQQDLQGVRWIELPENLGFSAGVNRGVSESAGNAVFLLNPDCEVSPGFLSKAMTHFREAEECSIMGFRQVDSQGSLQLSVGPDPGYFNELGRKWTQQQFDKGRGALLKAVSWYLEKPRKVSWVAGSALMVSRVDFDAIGGFDEEFFLYFEDIDFCLRAATQIGPVVYEPRVTLVHLRGESARSDSEAASTRYRESQLIFWRKHHGLLHEKIIRSYLRLTNKLPQ